MLIIRYLDKVEFIEEEFLLLVVIIRVLGLLG